MNSPADIFGIDRPYKPQIHSKSQQTETIITYMSSWRNT